MNTMQPSSANTPLAEEMTSPATVLGHSALVAEVGVRARDTADRIQMRHRSQIAAVIETGSDLITMKEQLGDELFCSWLQAQRGMNEVIARKYMRLATEFGEKLDIVSDLPLETLYKLTARTTPKSVKSAVLGYLARGELLAPEEIDRLVREVRRAEERIKKAEQEVKLTPRQRALRARRDAQFARSVQEHQQRMEHYRYECEQKAQPIADALSEKLGADLLALIQGWSMFSMAALRRALNAKLNSV